MKSNMAFEHHNVFILLEYSLGLFVVLFSILFEGFSQNLQAEVSSDSPSCCQCHNDIFEADISKTNVHQPFLQQKCSVCHIEDVTSEEEVNLTSSKNINWLDANITPAVEHWFNIPVDLISGGELIAVASDELCKSHEEVLPLPAFEMLQQKVDESSPYIITPEVLGVYRGILISACIGWSTDEESDSEVRYGIDNLRCSVKADNFTTEHEIVLQNLKSNQNYQYIVISRDIFGNRNESEIANFSTVNLSSEPQQESEQHHEADIQLDAQFFRNGNSCLLLITANYPVALKIGTEIINEGGEETLETSIPNDQNHLSMRNGNDLMVSVCIKCHPGRIHMVEHKINKFPPTETQISADYSTNSDGRITCVTCHANHASNYKFRTIKSTSQELCVGCHKGYDLSTEEQSSKRVTAR
jgi:predicted CXXCH cytochrome family protein